MKSPSEEFSDGTDGPDLDHFDSQVDRIFDVTEECLRDRKTDLYDVLRMFEDWPDPSLIDAQAAEKILNLARKSTRAGWQTAETVLLAISNLREILAIRRRNETKGTSP